MGPANSCLFAICAAVFSLMGMPGIVWAGTEGNSDSRAGVNIQRAVLHDVSPPLGGMSCTVVPHDSDANKDSMESDNLEDADDAPANSLAPGTGTAAVGTNAPAADTNAPALVVIPPAAVAVEQTNHGIGRLVELLASFDGLGTGFVGPQGSARFGNPSDNSLAVGPDHIVQIVNSRIAIFTKKGKRFDTTGKVLLGPVETRTVFKGFGDADAINNGDAVVRYDQLAKRWLIVMPIFRRLPNRTNAPPPAPTGGAAVLSQSAVTNQPGKAEVLYQPPPAAPTSPGESGTNAFPRGPRGPGARAQVGPYAICYAVSTGPDPLGSWFRYEFIRPLFPDYPRPAIWPDGYYVPTSTGDDVIQKQAFVVERDKMLKGEDAREQGIIVDGVNFLNCADIDGSRLPPRGAPNIVMAAGGTQLKHILEDDGIYVWNFHVDWKNPSKTTLEGPKKITVAPYHYLGGGQLSTAVPQPGVERRLDSQGDKIMQRLVYRRIGRQESIVAVHSIATSAGGGGVRWYEFRVGNTGKGRAVQLHQQGTYAPEGAYRWMASPAMDAQGNIGIGYSFGSAMDYPGQRFAGRLASDRPGVLTLHETVLAEGEASQTNTLRWEDYAQTAVDPSDDRTIWYVGDYLRKGERTYSTRIGAFRLTAAK
jgi:hypothetical protein